MNMKASGITLVYLLLILFNQKERNKRMTIFRVKIYNSDNKLIHDEYAHSNNHANKIASHWENLPVNLGFRIDKRSYRVLNSKQGWIDFLNKRRKEQNKDLQVTSR